MLLSFPRFPLQVCCWGNWEMVYKVKAPVAGQLPQGHHLARMVFDVEIMGCSVTRLRCRGDIRKGGKDSEPVTPLQTCIESKTTIAQGRE